jgi:hypothetical protein
MPDPVAEPAMGGPAPDAEWVAADDRIIGKALRWSAAAALAIGVLAAAAAYLIRREPPPPPPRVTALVPPTVPERPRALVPAVRFTDITAHAGITFVHHNGARGERLLPETMGGGVAVLDYDGDGRQDLLFINGTDWPWDTPSSPPPRHALYHNEGDWHFRDTTADAGLAAGMYGMGAAIGDYDNDGFPDIFLTAVGHSRLYHNQGDGTFHDVTAAAGVAGDANDWSTCAAFLDYDQDGSLDLFVGRYIQWSREIDAEIGFKIDGRTRAYGQPTSFEGAFPRFYRNRGDGTFADVSAAVGVEVRNPVTGVPGAKSLGVAPVDVDADGWIDLVVANDTVPNCVFMNRPNPDGGRRFEEIGAESGVAFDSYGNTRGAMGIDAAFHRNDDHLGIAIGNFANEMSALYVSQRAPTFFADEAIAEGIGPPTRLALTFATFFFDYDLDGWLDLLGVNGHLDEQITALQQSQQYRQAAQLFWNGLGAGHPGFIEASPAEAGPDLFTPIVGRGGAYADFDADGDLDLVLTQVAGAPLLLRNDQQTGHRWLRLHLEGTRSNRDAVGAWIHVERDGRRISRQVTATRGYLSQSELPVTIGLGSGPAPPTIEIVWPGGARQHVEPEAVNRTLRIKES